MFLERCGQMFFQQIRPLFFFLLLSLPILGSIAFLWHQKKEVFDLETIFLATAAKERKALVCRERKERFLARYQEPIPYFLDQYIESFLPLQREKRELEALLHHPAFPESPPLQERLQFLEENRLCFREEKLEVAPDCSEVEEKLRFSVQMDEEDLKTLLSRIEHVPIEGQIPVEKGPQLIIRQFHLKKGKTALQNEIFEIDLDLLKREFANL